MLRLALIITLWAGTAFAELIEPVTAACVSSPFGPRIIPNHPEAGNFHRGIDLPAPEGTPVRATAAGTVQRIQHSGPGGLEVLVRHTDFDAVYSHLATVAPLIQAGRTTVVAGEQLGTVGRTGLSFGPHLYFAMWRSGRPVDPAPELKVRPCSGHVPLMTPMAIWRAGGKLPPTRIYR